MKHIYIFIFFLVLINTVSADVGKIIKIAGPGDAYLVRNQEKIKLSTDLPLALNDEIFSTGSTLLIHLFPTAQVSISRNTNLKISNHLIEETGDLQKSFSVIDLIKGIIRLQVSKSSLEDVDLKVQVQDVTFGVRGTEFEVSSISETVDLDVIEGAVEVSSPHVQTFVPEIVKANEGFSFSRKEKNFRRRKFLLKSKDHPGFVRASDLRSRWKKQRARRNGKMEPRARKQRKRRGR